MTAPVSMAETVYPLDPYLLGLLIGDGSLCDGTPSFSTEDPELVNAVRAVVPAGLTLRRKSKCDYRITTGTRGGPPHARVNALTAALQQLGLWGHRSYTKFVPANYLLGSAENRLALLQGLMDSDGSPVKGGGAEFSTVSKQLLDDVVYLVQSLGGTARVGRPRRTTYSHGGERLTGALSYRVNCKLPSALEPFRLQRKLDRWQRPSKYKPTRMITNIRNLGYVEECVCIRVVAADQLYLTKDFVVTHNTPIGIACAEELLGCGDIDLCLVVCESSLKYQWAQKIAEFTDVPKRQIKVQVDGSVQTITVPALTHCVIIDGKTFQRNNVKFSAADDRKRQYESVITRTDYVIASYDNVVDDERWVRRLKPGMVILDEATAIKSFGAERTQKVKQILTAPYRLALTGTPVDNRADELFSIMQWTDDTVLGRWDLFDAAYIVRNDYGRVIRYKHLDILREKIAPAIARVSHDDPEVAAFIPKAISSELYVTPSDELLSAFLVIAADLLDALKRVKRGGGFDLAAYYAGKNDEDSAAGIVMAMLGAMDLLLAHPDCLVLSGQRYEDSLRRKELGETRKVWPGSKYAYTKWQEGLVDSVYDSPKLDRLAERVPEILAENDKYKVLVYTRQRDIIDYMADAIGLPHVQYHGGMNAKQKAAAQARFTQDQAIRVFLSSHAGARGVDLYKGSHLINYDLPWASGMADQINGRHVRVASEFREVWIENLITEGTTEEWKLDVLRFKRRVGSAILDGKGDRRGVVENEVTGLAAYLCELLDRG